MSDPMFGVQGGQNRPVPRGRFIFEEVPDEQKVVKLKFKNTELVVPKMDWRTTVGDLKPLVVKGKVRTAAYVNGVRVQEGCRPEWGDVVSFVELGTCEC